MKSNKETAIFVLEKLIEQGGCSIDNRQNYDGCDIKGCVYRASNSRKCAAGHLIPDDKYHEGLEGKSTHHRYISSLLEDYDLSFVRELQRFHDIKSDVMTDEEKVSSFKNALEVVSNTTENDIYVVFNDLIMKLYQP